MNSEAATPLRLEPRLLGRAGFHVPALSLGCAGLGHPLEVTDNEAVETIHLAMEQGHFYLDTAPLYNESERRVGLALRGVPRAGYRLSTKTGTHPLRRGDYSRDGTLWSVENSLKLLGVDYLDLLLIHDPDSMEPVLAPGGALDTLEELRDQKVIGAIGLGQRLHAFHRLALETGRFDVILTYNDYHPVRTTAAAELMPLARRCGVGIINGSPLGHGLLQGLPPEKLPERIRQFQTAREYRAAGRLLDWCVRRNLDMPGLALRFCLLQPMIDVTLTGAKNRAELRQNLAGADQPIDSDFWCELAALDLTQGQV